MKILVFGGAFDPPHRGHLALLKSAARAVEPDRVLIVPGFQTPWKDPACASAQDRLGLIRLMLGELPASLRRRVKIDVSEASSRRKVYTVETLERLTRENPGAALHFVVGSDAAKDFALWKDPRRLARLAAWWTARRPGFKGRLPDHFNVLPGRMPDVSSTRLRRQLALGEPVGGAIMPAVIEAIERRRLYGVRTLAELRRSLSPGRFEHSLHVARLAESLAAKWNAGPDKARLAGLLHDCGRRLPAPSMPAYARKNRLRVPDFAGIVRHNPLLLHAYIGEDVARRRFGVLAPDVLSAIRNHTLGAARMALLDRVLYVADACSEDRKHPQAAALRALAFQDLDAAFRGCVAAKIAHALSNGGWLHPLTVSLWNSLQ